MLPRRARDRRAYCSRHRLPPAGCHRSLDDAAGRAKRNTVLLAVRTRRTAGHPGHRSRCARDGLAFGQDRHSGVVTMQTLGCQHMGLDQGMQRLQHHAAGANLIRQRRHAEIDTLAGIALALPVQGLMLAELKSGNSPKPTIATGLAPRKQQLIGNPVPTRRRRYQPRSGKTILHDPQLCRIRPATTATRVNNFKAADLPTVGYPYRQSATGKTIAQDGLRQTVTLHQVILD